MSLRVFESSERSSEAFVCTGGIFVHQHKTTLSISFSNFKVSKLDFFLQKSKTCRAAMGGCGCGRGCEYGSEFVEDVLCLGVEKDRKEAGETTWRFRAQRKG